MKDMLLVILNRLKELHPNSFYETADTTQDTYIVFDVTPLSSAEKDRYDNILEVDVYDRTSDPGELEDLTSNIDRLLKSLRFSDDKQAFWLQRVYRGNIPDPDPNIRRRQIRYQIKRYEVE